MTTYLTTREVADELRMSEATLRDWRYKDSRDGGNRGPAFEKWGDSKNAPVRYTPEAVKAWRARFKGVTA